MARMLQEQVIRELEETIGVCENYRSVDRASGEVVVYYSEKGPLRPATERLARGDTSITRDVKN